MTKWNTPALGILLSMSLMLQPLSAGGAAFIIPPSSVHPAVISFSEQAIVAPLMDPLTPLIRGVKVKSVILYQHIQLPLARLMSPWGAYLNFLHYLPAFFTLESAVFQWAAMLPFGSLEEMRNMLSTVDPERHSLWESVNEFISIYFSPEYTRLHSKDIHDAGLTLTQQVENTKLLAWLHGPEVRLKESITGAVMEIRLKELPNTGHLISVDSAFDRLKEAQARSPLLEIALKSKDYTHVAAAVDALEAIGARKELSEFLLSDRLNEMKKAKGSGVPEDIPIEPESRQFNPTQFALVPWILPILARFNLPERYALLKPALRPDHSGYRVDAMRLLRTRFQLPRGNVARTALRLLAFDKTVTVQDARRLLASLVGPEKDALLKRLIGPEKDLYLMIAMLGILQVVTQSAAGTYEDSEKLMQIRKQITRTHWSNAGHSFMRPSDLPQLAREVGTQLHQDTGDPAVASFMGLLFEMVFRNSILGESPFNFTPPKLDETRIRAAQKKAVIPGAQEAALAQYSVFRRVLEEHHRNPPNWMIYRSATLELLTAKEPLSLSQLALQLMNNLIGSEKLLIHGQALSARERRVDTVEKAWKVVVPLAPDQSYDEMEAVFKQWEDVPQPKSYEGFIHMFTTVFFPGLIDLEFNRLKYNKQAKALWHAYKAIIQDGADPQKVIKPMFLEIHPDDHCQNKCTFCKGQLREGPDKEMRLSEEHMMHLIVEAHKLNPDIFVRISGSVGDPFMNPATVNIMRKMNSLGIEYGLTTNGLHIPEEALEVMFAKGSTCNFFHSSLDADSDENYTWFKQSKMDKPFTRYMSNMERLTRARKDYRRKGGGKALVVVSYLLQEEEDGSKSNMKGIPSVSKALKKMGVDLLKFNIQHFDTRRQIVPAHLTTFFEVTLPALRKRDQKKGGYRIIAVPAATAHLKNEGPVSDQVQPLHFVRKDNSPTQFVNMVPFRKCMASWSTLVGAADAAVQACCQYADPTLGAVGSLLEASLPAILMSQKRKDVLSRDPRKFCKDCAHSDFKLNSWYEFLEDSHAAFPDLINEYEKILMNYWSYDERRAADEDARRTQRKSTRPKKSMRAAS
jgi:hypothetical protein